ncbi:hypothetical protein NLG97_g6959 [Lecanicillium saksenae]|uniref:Uncharacterized protein n=1 Tax=Lecanicillium saksenae TaxID=468837 RepID=A0ACC1QNP8_9HYPO|nr:hypothetical protein NLG97_g6959 [Lecanicillium saksenae]
MDSATLQRARLYITSLSGTAGKFNAGDSLEQQSPASDYAFLKSQYPVPSGTPDLKAQVEKFLSLPPETKRPKSTLWIFTFGTWEVWNLASLPTVTAHDLLDSMVENIFQYAELLYLKSLNPRSIAFSHFWSDIDPADVQKLTSPNVHRKIDERALETFRILIPKLFDITLAPIWQSRAVPPYPHTRAEHLRNAIALTQRWNEQVEKQMGMWQKRARYKPKRLEDERKSGDQAATRDFSAAMSEAGIPKSAPYPKRMGAQLTATVDGVIETMMHAEMKHSGSYDSAGNGMQPANASMVFTNVWAPCVAGALDIPEGDEMGLVKTPCEAPDEYLFHDEATFGQRAVDHIVASAAKAVLNTLFPRARYAK